MSSLRLWRTWTWNRVKMTVALVVIASLGATPAWALDRWVVRLAPVVYLGLSLALIGTLLAVLDFNGQVRRWKAAEERVRATSTGRV